MNNLAPSFNRKASTKVEWRYSEKGQKVRVVFPSEVILNPLDTAEVLPDGTEPKVYIGNNCTSDQCNVLVRCENV